MAVMRPVAFDDPGRSGLAYAAAASRIAAAEAGSLTLPVGAVLAGLLIVSAIIGVLIALESLPLLVLAGGGLAGVLAILLPLEFLLWSLLVLTLYVQGPIANFLKLPAAAWLPYGMAALLFLRSLLELLGGRARRRPPATTGPIGALLLLYLGTIAASAVINRSPLSQIAVGLKTYAPFWAVTFALLFNAWEGRQLAQLWRLFPLGLLLQVPVVAYQVLVVVPGRREVGTRSAFDAVVGTFGGDGGNSSFLVLFCIAATVLAFARVQLRIGRLSLALGILLVSVALTLGGEVKAAFLWIPLALGVAFHDVLLKRPAVLFGAIATLAIFTVAMSVVYEAMHWRHKTVDNRPLVERIERASEYFFDPAQVNYQTGEISRGASIALWVHDRRSDWPNRLVGYGPAASRAKSVVAIGTVAKRFAPLAIAATTMAMLLWDAGVLALIFFVALLLTALASAVRLMHARWLPAPHRAACRMAVAVFAIDLTLLFYNRSLVDEPCTQLLLALLVGYVAWLRANRPGARAST